MSAHTYWINTGDGWADSISLYYLSMYTSVTERRMPVAVARAGSGHSECGTREEFDAVCEYLRRLEESQRQRLSQEFKPVESESNKLAWLLALALCGFAFGCYWLVKWVAA